MRVANSCSSSNPSASLSPVPAAAVNPSAAPPASPSVSLGAPVGRPPVAAPRRRLAAVDFESDFDDEDAPFMSSASPASVGHARTISSSVGQQQQQQYAYTLQDSSKEAMGPGWRDQYRQCFMNMPCRMFHLFVLSATMLLLVFALLQPSSTQATWYHFLEFVVILIFVVEVTSRLYIARSHFWVSKVNVIETGICAVCVIAFVAMSIGRQGGSRTEHEVVMGLRYLAQLLRVSVFLKSGWRTAQEVTSIHLPPIVMATTVSTPPPLQPIGMDRGYGTSPVASSGFESGTGV